MYLSHLKVTEKNINVDTNTYNPIRFKAGDVITIDNRKAIVLRNGQPIFTELDPASDFFSIDKGMNGIVVTPAVADVNIRFRERWL
jgi:phage-related protein